MPEPVETTPDSSTDTPQAEPAAEAAEFPELPPIKKAFLEALADRPTTLSSAAAEVGRAPRTIWNWRHADPAFDEAVRVAIVQQRKLRLAAVEDAVFAQILKGNAPAGVTIFWLKRHSKEWRMADKVVHGLEGTVRHLVAGEISDEDLKRLTDAQLRQLVRRSGTQSGEESDEADAAE